MYQHFDLKHLFVLFNLQSFTNIISEEVLAYNF